MERHALEGDLACFVPSEVLQLLQLAQASGRLTLSRGEERVELYLDRGRLVFARTSGLSVRLGEVLMHRGAVAPPALARALERQRLEPGLRIGQCLVAAGDATEAQVRDAVHEVLRRIVYGLLLWREGRFEFAPGETSPGGDIPIDLDLDRLILEGLRLADQQRAAGRPGE